MALFHPTSSLSCSSRRTVLRALGSGVALASIGGVSTRALAAKAIKVAAVYDVPVEQQWVSRIHQAAAAAVRRGDIEYVVAEKTANSDFERVMREFCEAGHEFIIADVFSVEDAARAVAKDYPNAAFLLGSSFKADPAIPNLAVFDSYIHDASYLSGLVAGAMTKTKNVGIVGGYPIPTVNRQMNAFIAGVRDIAPDARIQVSFIGSWFDPPKAKETAFAQIDGGADVLFAERFGVSDAAKERGKFTIGNIIDTQPDYPETVVTSILWHFEPTLDRAIADFRSGNFKADDYGEYSFMKSGGCSLAPLGTFEGKVPAEIMAVVTEKEAAIKSGTMTVAIVDSEPKST